MIISFFVLTDRETPQNNTVKHTFGIFLYTYYLWQTAIIPAHKCASSMILETNVHLSYNCNVGGLSSLFQY